ncbi:hypothetical protein AV530_012878 [Patagioenas fasciata monilis]|uniref:Uncharacterized protein n=1 Tax=Patagioenas fasciata monilis TaxID=372326 RepID=A0A1V4J9S7_PATFA|nr:hypothetical protein AV530_012878 [Patagioenas fasciata monilis]
MQKTQFGITLSDTDSCKNNKNMISQVMPGSEALCSPAKTFCPFTSYGLLWGCLLARGRLQMMAFASWVTHPVPEPGGSRLQPPPSANSRAGQRGASQTLVWLLGGKPLLPRTQPVPSALEPTRKPNTEMRKSNKKPCD